MPDAGLLNWGDVRYSDRKQPCTRPVAPRHLQPASPQSKWDSHRQLLCGSCPYQGWRRTHQQGRAHWRRCHGARCSAGRAGRHAPRERGGWFSDTTRCVCIGLRPCRGDSRRWVVSGCGRGRCCRWIRSIRILPWGSRGCRGGFLRAGRIAGWWRVRRRLGRTRGLWGGIWVETAMSEARTTSCG